MNRFKSPADAPNGTRRYLNERELAAQLGFSKRTLQGWRVSGFGMPYLKIGHAVRYDVELVEKWLAERQCSHTSEAGLKQPCSMRQASHVPIDQGIDAAIPTLSSPGSEGGE